MTPRRVMFVLIAYLAAIWLVFGAVVACRAETVTIDEAAFYNDSRFEVLYRIDGGEQLTASTLWTSPDLRLKLPQTSVEILWTADEWIVQAEPTVRIIWK